jgi:hypothetical protein
MCERVGNAIICGRGSRKKLGKCQECWVVEATVLCDGPVRLKGARPGTCDKPLCRGCAMHVAPDRDYCKSHKDPASRRLAL